MHLDNLRPLRPRLEPLAVYYAIKAEPKLDTRYLIEDIPYGLVPWEDLARMTDTQMPVCTALIDLANTLLEQDFRASGQTMVRIGLGGLTAEQLIRLVTEGI